MILNLSFSILVAALLMIASAQNASADDCQCSQVKPVAKVLPITGVNMEFIAHFIPTNMPQGQVVDGNLFMVQFGTGVGQKIADEILRGDLFRKSAIGQMTTKVEKFSSASVKTGSAAISQINFQVKAVERQAVLAIKGFINSDVIYSFEKNSFNWVLSHQVAKDTTIAFTNVGTVAGISSSTLSLTRNF